MAKTLHVAGGSYLYESSFHHSLFTPEDFTTEQKLIHKTAIQFIDREVRPLNGRIENQEFTIVVDLLKKAGNLGLLAHSVPEKYGGLGLDKVSKAIVGEAVGRSGSYGVAHSNHTCIATLPITYFGTKKQKEKYLPKLASGEYIGAYCLTEPNAGSDALASQTTAMVNKEETHYVLNGTKIYITNGAFSDTFIVYAKVNGNLFSAFIVEKGFPGLIIGPEEQKMGIKGSSTTTVTFDHCLVPKENLLGVEGKGHLIALNVLNLGRFNLGSACVGAAKLALELAISYTKERYQFGKSIADFPATKEKIAHMASRIYAAESIQYRTAGYLEESLGDLDSTDDREFIGKRLMEYAMECSICKVYGSELLDEISDEALQLHGGAGFIQDYQIERIYRDARINRIFEGTNEINRLLLPTLLYRKMEKGEIDLESSIKKALHELSTKQFSDVGGEFSVENNAVASIRNVFLACTNAVYQEYGEKLVEEQEALMKLSNIAIELFAAESCLARCMKYPTPHSKVMTKYIIEKAVLQTEVLSKQLINQAVAGDIRRSLINMITSHFQTIDLFTTKDEIRGLADVQVAAEHYVTKS
ncbi:acyl-CoA dehydrogenase family protein [Bacillus weihaiensis]|uniref:Acyl-CoA dehydrogenase n=1 Tax=Bacillus weihaiensis TaxID=1547283 RepID=A0A1L3MT75_9BACI|nr:acyl-CoA dehydrogenase family protein [Bacillus weihaiensis]APH05504.1 acyl-CoA dehydrogenase [Bacillus weihaiensis]